MSSQQQPTTGYILAAQDNSNSAAAYADDNPGQQNAPSGSLFLNVPVHEEPVVAQVFVTIVTVFRSFTECFCLLSIFALVCLLLFVTVIDFCNSSYLCFQQLGSQGGIRSGRSSGVGNNECSFR